MAVRDVLTGRNREVKRHLVDDMNEAVESGRFAAILVDEDQWRWDILEMHYRQAERISYEADAFYPVTGTRMRPQRLYRSRR